MTTTFFRRLCVKRLQHGHGVDGPIRARLMVGRNNGRTIFQDGDLPDSYLLCECWKIKPSSSRLTRLSFLG